LKDVWLLVVMDDYYLCGDADPSLVIRPCLSILLLCCCTQASVLRLIVDWALWFI